MDPVSNNKSAEGCKCDGGGKCGHCAKKCGCMHHSMVPIILILIALTFLFGTTGVLSVYTVGIIWPILVIIGSGMKMMSHRCKCC